MKVAVLQMTGGIDPAANARVLTEAATDAVRQGAVMLFTPEMSNLVDRDRDRASRSVGRENEDVVLAAARTAAAEHRLWIHLGSCAVRRADARFANRAFVIDDGGQIRARYDKLHLFDVDLADGGSWRESTSYAAGDRAVAAETPVGRLGLSICYDLRFPDLYRALSDAGATVLAVPAAFTRPTGAAHWHALLRARAIEAGAFVIAAAQTGEHEDGRSTYGHSLVVDPWGEMLLDMSEEAGLAVVDLELKAVGKVRARIPALRHRQPIPPVTVVQ